MTKTLSTAVASLLLPLVLTACFHDEDEKDDDVTLYRYQISVINVSNNQPLSPMAVVLHNAGYGAWTPGMAASTGLEALAEGGDGTEFLAEADANNNVLATGTGNGLIIPGASDTVELVTMTADNLQLTVASMLVNTNDAFSGVAAHKLGSLGVGDSLRIYAKNYDAGTEADSETAATIPGPAGGGTGEGFNSARDDSVNFVAIHSGVVTMADGLTTSALDESHRFNGSVSMISITRTE
jgi:hypothetical protein